MNKEVRKIGAREISLIIVAFFLVLPSLAITLYSYPCQDDFHYAFFGKELMNQGYGLLAMSWERTVQHYEGVGGCYTSSFLGYFLSGIIDCNIWGIRIFELISGLIFYFSLYTFIRAWAYKVMGFSIQKVLPLYCLLLACFNCLIYYSENEDFYWFITSIQYLFISSIILFGITFFIAAIMEENKKRRVVLFILASLGGFLGSGGTLSIAAFCCALYFLVAVWGTSIRKYVGASWVVMGATLLGSIINGIAPGNYSRYGQPLTINKLFEAVIYSFKYTLERWENFVRNPVFWIILILLATFLLTCESDASDIQFKYPIFFIGFLFCVIAGIIFPTVLGYGYECYAILCRGNFISDMAFYFFIFFSLFYIKGWFDRKYATRIRLNANRDIVIASGLLIIALLVLDRNNIGGIPVAREYRDWIAGKYDKYAEFCIEIYEEVAESSEDTVEIYRKFVEDDTCMINPQFYVGWYDPAEEYANTTIARFYGKSAIHIYFEETSE